MPEPPSFPLAAEKKQPKAPGRSGPIPQGPTPELQTKPHTGATEAPAESAAGPATGDATAAAAANPSQAPAAAQAGSRQGQGSGETGAAKAADKGLVAVAPPASSTAPRSSAPAQQPVPGLPELAHSVSFVGRPVEAVQVAVSLAEPSSTASGSTESLSVEVAGDQVGAPAAAWRVWLTIVVAASLCAAGGALFNNIITLAPCTQVQVSLGCCKQVFVAVPGRAPLALALPFGVDAMSGTGQLSEDGRQLRLSLPFKPHRMSVEEVGVCAARACTSCCLCCALLMWASGHVQAKRSCATSMDSYLFLDSPLMQLDV